MNRRVPSRVHTKKTIHEEARDLVLQRARELCQRHPEIPDIRPLADALAIFDTWKAAR